MSVIIIDDSSLARQTIALALKSGEFGEVHFASSAAEAFELLGVDGEGRLPDLEAILLDIVMPEIDGIETCARIKKEPHLAAVPVIMVTGSGDSASLKKAFGAGACDFIRKPFDDVELIVRLNSVLQTGRERAAREEREVELLAVKRKLESANRRLQHLATLDPLTGVPNRRRFDEVLNTELTRNATRNTADSVKELSVIMVDIDFFKRYNDCYGHSAGDTCLCSVAAALQNQLKRPGDVLARYGGEEFASILPETSGSGATELADRMCRAVAALGIKHEQGAPGGKVTVSVGVATGVAQDVRELIKAADAALYQAKDAGRNCVISSSPNGNTRGARA